MANERLRTAMAAAQVDLDAIIEATGVDPKTVQRWMNGRTPLPATDRTSSSWSARTRPTCGRISPTGADAGQQADPEFDPLSAHRADVPANSGRHLFTRRACNRRPGLRRDVPARAATRPQQRTPGEKGRPRLRDSRCARRPRRRRVKTRGDDEHFGPRHRLALPGGVAALSAADRSTVGQTSTLHDTTLYNSIYRFDDELLVNAHLYGDNAYARPSFTCAARRRSALLRTTAVVRRRLGAGSTPTT